MNTDPAALHPRGLYTLFFTELWARMSYYGMKALLVLFMSDQLQHGGMGLTKGASLGNLIAGLFAGEVTGEKISAMPARFLQVVWVAGGTGLLLLVCSKPIRTTALRFPILSSRSSMASPTHAIAATRTRMRTGRSRRVRSGGAGN